MKLTKQCIGKSFIAGDRASILVDSGLIPVGEDQIISIDRELNVWIGPAEKVSDALAISGFCEI